MTLTQKKLRPFDPEIKEFFEKFDLDTKGFPKDIRTVELDHTDIVSGTKLDDYKRIDSAFNELLDASIAFKDNQEASRLEGDNFYGKANIIESWTHNTSKRKYIITITDFSCYYMYAVYQLQHGFVNMNPQYLLDVRSTYAKFWLWKLAVIQGRQERKFLEYTVDEIKSLLNVPKYNWTHIRQRILDPAFDEIDKSTKFSPAWRISRKRGKRVTAFQIYLKDKEESEPELPFSVKAYVEDVNKQVKGSQAYMNLYRTLKSHFPNEPSQKSIDWWLKRIPLEKLGIITYDYMIMLQEKKPRATKEWLKKQLNQVASGEPYLSYTKKKEF
jgi:hypothetical protein